MPDGDRVLDSIDMVRLGQELQAARKRTGLTQEAAAAAIGLARTTLTSIESGERRIREGELIKLARAYKRQLSDFLRPRPPLEAVAITQAQFRGPYLKTQEDLQAIEPAVQELQELSRDYLELEEITHSPMPHRYPQEYRLGVLPVEQAAEEVALEERHRLRLGDGPLPLLRDVLEQDVGLRIFYIPLEPSSKFAAVYLCTEVVGGSIAVNSKHPEERRRMSLSHEYGHFLTTRYKPEVLVESGYRRLPESERFASLFALHFLMPASGLTRRFNEMIQARGTRIATVGQLCELANQYGVSVEAMVERLEMLRLVGAGTWESLKHQGIQVRKIQQQLGLAGIPGRNDMLPHRFQSLAIQAFAEGLISEGRLAEFLRVDRLDARRAVESLLGDDVEVGDFTNGTGSGLVQAPETTDTQGKVSARQSTLGTPGVRE
jgi:Zn-dependent peptidase ImmA (M78 family)/DNA-binding XRE family transcriptional regulator